MAVESNFVNPHPMLTRLLRALLPEHSRDSITGDLLEEFQELAQTSPARARRWYALQVWSFVTAAPWFACAVRTSATWLAAFIAACIAVLASPVFLPAWGVAVFLFAIPCSAFFVAFRTQHFRAGFATSVATGLSMVSLAAALIRIFSLRHPPSAANVIPALLCVPLAAVFALAGKCAGERLEPTRLAL